MGLEKLNDDQKKYIAIGVLGLILLGTVYIIISGDKGTLQSKMSKPELEEKRAAYEDKLNTSKKRERSTLSDYFGDDDLIDTTKLETVYSEEEDPRIIEMQRQIELLEQKRNSVSSKSVTKTSTTKSKESKEETEAERLAYIKRMREAREAHNNKTKSITIPTASKITAVIYGDQYLLPGDRLELALPEDINIEGRVYSKGTPIFAYVTISKSRVLLDINNIEGDKMRIAVEDAWDHREGIYSRRAGELWREFQQNQEEKLSGEVADEISSSTGAPIVGSAIQDISNFFKKKRLRKQQKILLVNNHKVILNIL